MDFWQKARSFAEEAAKEAAKRSEVLTKGAAEIVSETAKKSKELAVEATKKADQLKIEALKRADQIKSLTDGISPQIPSLVSPIDAAQQQLRQLPLPLLQQQSQSQSQSHSQLDLEKFGVTDDLREFVKGITISTFQDFPMQDEPEMSDVPTVSNVRQDLTEWQATHATLVLSSVKEIAKLRYELCPRHMKERKFWRIYFLLVNTHVAPYEKQYVEAKLKSTENEKSDEVKEDSTVHTTPKPEMKETKQSSKTSTSASAEHDLDVFLLGDLGSSDEGPDDGEDTTFDDDLDNIVNNSDDDEKSKK